MLKTETGLLNRAVGRLLRKERVGAGMTQSELAKKANVSRATVSSVESGAQGITLETLFDLAEALGCCPTNLIPTLADRKAPIPQDEGEIEFLDAFRHAKRPVDPEGDQQ